MKKMITLILFTISMVTGGQAQDSTLAIVDVGVWKNEVCITLNEIVMVDWYLQPSDGSFYWELQASNEWEVGMICHQYTDCDLRKERTFKIVATNLDGEEFVVYGQVRVKPKMSSDSNGIYIFPCGRTDYTIYDSTGRLIERNYGDQLNTQREDLPRGVYYLKLHNTLDTLSFMIN